MVVVMAHRIRAQKDSENSLIHIFIFIHYGFLLIRIYTFFNFNTQAMIHSKWILTN